MTTAVAPAPSPTAVSPAATRAGAPRWVWIHTPSLDLTLAFAWVPFAAMAIEYFAIVNQTLAKRYKAQPGGGALGRAVRLPFGRPLFYVTYIGIIAAISFSLRWHGSPTLYAVVYLTLGGMHVFYDGFIWKLRRPEVAGSVGATT